MARDRWVRVSTTAGLASLLAASTACVPDVFSAAEYRAAIDATVAQGEGLAVENEILEITTSFTVGGSVSKIIEEVQAFTASQVPCATVDKPDPFSLIIDFGELGDQCEFRGRTYAGVVSVEFDVNSGSVGVAHTYDGLTNGDLTIDGTADVSWAPGYRYVVTDFTLEGARGTAEVSSEREQVFVDPDAGLAGGVEISGERRWSTSTGDWLLEIDAVQWRGVDPVPQSGSYFLLNPEGKELDMSFSRVDEDTIAVTVTGGLRTRMFHVTSAGRVTDEGDA